MKVILDISWLGYDETRVGLWRAIESLAVRLARHPGCDVRFSAHKSRTVVNRTRRYLTSHPLLPGESLIGQGMIQAVHRGMEARLAAMNASASRGIAFRAVRRVARWGVRSLERVEPLRREDLTGTDVFHSPCHMC